MDVHFARDVKVVLPDLRGALADRRRPVCNETEGLLKGLVDAECVGVEGVDDEARKVLELGRDAGVPITEPILDLFVLGEPVIGIIFRR